MFGSRYIFLEELHRIVKSGPGTGIGTELDGIQCHLRVEIAAAQKNRFSCRIPPSGVYSIDTGPSSKL